MLRKPDNDLSGILLVDKPAGITSFAVVERIRKASGIRKVGHAGTLDPQATGLLIIFLGSATRLSSRFLHADKAYSGHMTIGVETDTADGDGKVIREQEKADVAEEQVKEAFKKFLGKIKQVPPMYSAAKHKGERLYKLARAGKEVEREAKEINIYKFEMLEFIPDNHPRVLFEVWCSKGTYVRQLAVDIGKVLGCGAYLSSLTRIFSHPFHLSQALSLEAVLDLIKIGNLDTVVIKPEDLLKMVDSQAIL